MGFISDSISGTTISGGTFYGNGSNLTGVSAGNTLQQVLVNGNISNGNNIIMSESDNIIFKYAGYNNNINTNALTSNRVILFPDNSGTVALLSDIQTFTGGTVTGSTTFTNGLSANTFSADTIYVSGNSITPKYKVYTALLTQNGTSNPSVTVIENTLGVITINRDSAGRYSVNSSSLFVSNKTIVYINTITTSAGPYGGYASISNNSQNTIYIDTTKVIGSGGGIPGTGTDNVLYNTSFEIRVYN